jgi:medium-chain acyl-[acyl-carrier-protein] hydrolase
VGGPPIVAEVVRLVCLPYAGGGATAVFRAWRNQFAPVAEPCPLELPGRAARLREPPSRRIRELAIALATSLEARRGEPLAFFGHSLGALLAFEVVREMRRRGAPPPRHLFVSSRRGPRIPEPHGAIHEMPDAAFLAEVQRRYDAIPVEVLREPDLMQLLLPTLRADFEMLETYEYAAEEPLECPITAIGGREDPLVPLGALEAWRLETSGPFRLRQFPGGHFYFRAADDDLADLVRRTLEGGVVAPRAH